MPLTSFTRVYKNFPASFADKVSQHVRRRTETYRVKSDDLEEDDKDDKELELYNEKSDQGTKKAFRQYRTRSSPSPSPHPFQSPRTSPRPSPSPRGPTPSPRTVPSPHGIQPRPVTAPAVPSPRPGGDRKLKDDIFSNGTYLQDLESPSPDSSKFGPAFKTISFTTPRMLRTHSRTTVSLDNVDLWESDVESSECESSGHFDRINGLLINPNKTFDFSELKRSRSPVSPSDDFDEPCLVRPTPLKSSVKKDVCALPPLPLSRTTKQKSVHHKNKDSHLGENKKQINSSHKHVRRKTSTNDTRKPHSNHSSSMTKQSENGKKREKTKVRFSRQTDTKLFSHQEDAEETIVDLSPKPSPKLRKTNFSQLPNGFQKSDTNSDESHNSGSPTRRVKFHDFVTVCDGENSTLDKLRHSNNSAQLIKQKYLGVGATDPQHSINYNYLNYCEQNLPLVGDDSDMFWPEDSGLQLNYHYPSHYRV